MVRALQALRGVDLIVAVTFITEIGDVRRFKSPRQLMGFVSRVTPVHTRNCTRDGGGPFGNVAETSGYDLGSMVERGERKRTAAEASKCD
jgi:hypothetical protein